MSDENVRSQLKKIVEAEHGTAQKMLTHGGYLNPIIGLFRGAERLAVFFVRGGMNASTGVMAICAGAFQADTVVMTMDSYTLNIEREGATAAEVAEIGAGLIHPVTGQPCSMGEYFQAGNPDGRVREMLHTSAMRKMPDGSFEQYAQGATYRRQADPCPVCQRDWGTGFGCSFCTEEGEPRVRPVLDFEAVGPQGFGTTEGNQPDAMREALTDPGPLGDEDSDLNRCVAVFSVMQSGLVYGAAVPPEMQAVLESEQEEAMKPSFERDLVLAMIRTVYGTENH